MAKRAKTFFHIAWPGALVLGISFLVGCESRPGSPPGGMPPGAGKPPEVQVALPISQEITDYEEFTGRTEAIAAVDVRAHLSGYVHKVGFKDGDIVKKGDLLFEIDPRVYEAELKRAQATVVQGEAHFQRLEADYQRAKSLLPQKAISREDFDKILGDRAEAEAAVGVAKANRDLAKVNLEYTKITAYIGGRISRRFVDPGNLIKADETSLTTIGAFDPIYVAFDIDERTVLRLYRLIQQGKIKSVQEAEIPFFIGLADDQGFPHPGKLNFVDNKIDAGTGTLRVRGVLPNPKQAFFPGLFVRIRLMIGDPHPAILVAERAMVTDQEKKVLFVLNGKDEVENRQVTVGPLNDGMRVITKGVAMGERVIVSGLQRVRPGIPVVPKMVPMTPTANDAGKQK